MKKLGIIPYLFIGICAIIILAVLFIPWWINVLLVLLIVIILLAVRYKHKLNPSNWLSKTGGTAAKSTQPAMGFWKKTLYASASIVLLTLAVWIGCGVYSWIKSTAASHGLPEAKLEILKYSDTAYHLQKGISYLFQVGYSEEYHFTPADNGIVTYYLHQNQEGGAEWSETVQRDHIHLIEPSISGNKQELGWCIITPNRDVWTVVTNKPVLY
jgi:hypothetical protein